MVYVLLVFRVGLLGFGFDRFGFTVGFGCLVWFVVSIAVVFVGLFGFFGWVWVLWFDLFCFGYWCFVLCWLWFTCVGLLVFDARFVLVVWGCCVIVVGFLLIVCVCV